jgi:hypothetical protein
MVGGYFYDTHGAGVLSDVTATVEEFGEMSGLILFIYAIHDYLSTSRFGEAD